MSDNILTQTQIDELLSELLSGTIDSDDTEQTGDKRVKNYDFRSPKKFSKDQLKVVRSVYENFARAFASYLSGILRMPCQIKVTTIEEQPYFEYNNALPDSVMMGVYDITSQDGTLLVDLSSAVIFTIIERLLGGEGSGTVVERDFTQIEVGLMKRVYRQIASITRDAWSNYSEMDIALKNIETNSRLMQLMAMDEAVVIIIMEIELRSVMGTISICIPNIQLEPLLDEANQRFYFSKRKLDSIKDSQNREAILSHIKDTQIEMVCVLGDAVLSFQDVINLQEGDVIKLDQSVDSQVKLCIGDRPWFHGIPGIMKNKKHIKITKVL